MAVKFKIDVLEALKNNGYSSYRIRKEKLLAESTLQKLRDGNTGLNVEVVGTLCELLNCQPGDIIEYIPE